ncbi:MAG TPA: DUF4232 domain-containing protein [Acidimicrobiales bacterium]|nr:DUF4232 domain-containing protein [Acidimicrobiales bacterium]
MTLAPVREVSGQVLLDPTELLIKEAREKTRRRRFKLGKILLAVVVLALVVAYGIGHIDNVAQPKTATSSNLRAAASAPRCSLSQLSLISDHGGWHANYAAGGQFTETLTFTNVSRSACQLSGWPRVQAVGNGALQATPMTMVYQSGPPSSKASGPVHLAPGKTASFDIYGGDWNPVQNKACPQTTSGLLVSPPGDSARLAVAVEEPDCGGFYVSPLIAGSSDRESWSFTVQ